MRTPREKVLARSLRLLASRTAIEDTDPGPHDDAELEYAGEILEEAVLEYAAEIIKRGASLVTRYGGPGLGLCDPNRVFTPQQRAELNRDLAILRRSGFPEDRAT